MIPPKRIKGRSTPKTDLLFMVLGDSISAGRGESVGTAVSSGVLEEYNGSSFVSLTTAEVSTALTGSPWKKFALDLNATTGRKIVLSCNGSGGAEWYPNGDNNNWYSSGSLRAAAKTKTDAMIAAKGRTSLDGIILILGINDARGAVTIGNILIGMDSLITWLNTNYPSVPLFIAQIGREESGDTTRVLDVRSLIYNSSATLVYNDGIQHGLGLCQRYSTVKMAFDEMPNFTSMGYIRTDNLHPNQAGNNYMGAGFATYIKNYLGI